MVKLTSLKCSLMLPIGNLSLNTQRLFHQVKSLESLFPFCSCLAWQFTPFTYIISSELPIDGMYIIQVLEVMPMPTWQERYPEYILESCGVVREEVIQVLLRSLLGIYLTVTVHTIF